MPVQEEQVLEREANDKGGSKDKPETITVTKADYDRLTRERNESRESEKFWADRARAGGKGAAAEVEEEEGIETDDLIPAVTGAEGVDESIFSDPEKWLAAIAKGPKAVQDLIKKEGYVNAKQVAEIAAKVARRTVDVERGKITTDNKLMTQFPELADEKSELFKATAEEYKALIEFDPEAKKSPSTLFAAARAAKARMKPAARSRDDEEDDDPYERVERGRRDRVAAQDGSRGGRGSGGEEQQDRIGPQQKAVLEGMGVSEDKFRASRQNIGGGRRK